MTANNLASVRPTKKQRELLAYIEQFIGQHGYSPSYREIMNGQGYTSVATVSLHINSLIRRGHLRKRDRSARSLEVIGSTDKLAAEADSKQQWLVGRVTKLISSAEAVEVPSPQSLNNIQTLLAALTILGYGTAAAELESRLQALQEKAS